ncbi:SAM-dependent methyltransferase [Actinoallomurus acanthiterrae]
MPAAPGGGRPRPRASLYGGPVGLMLMGILGLVPDHTEACSIVRRLVAALPAGSHLALYDGTDTDPAYVEAIRAYNAGSGAVPYTPRSLEQITAFFDGLELLSPGVVSVTRWRPEPSPWGEPPEVACAGGVARKR